MFNFYENVRKPNVLKDITIEQYVQKVKNGEHARNILKAREAGKGTTLYQQIKLKQPAVTLNFTFENSRRNANAINSTGYLMFDVDDKCFSPSSLDPSNFSIINKSFGGQGYTLVTRVDGITPENFKVAYNWVAQQVGLSEMFDVNARSISQSTILSYDPEIHFNSSSRVFDATALTTEENQPQIEELVTPNNDYKDLLILGGDQKKLKGYRFNNSADFFNGEHKGKKYLIGDFAFVEVTGTFNYKIWEGGRSKFLYVNGCNLKYLNRGISYDGMVKVLGYLNSNCCEPTLRPAEIESLVKGIISSETKPKAKSRKIIFNDAEHRLTRAEKYKVLGEYQKELHKSKKVDEIAAFLETYDGGKITKNTIRKGLGMHSKTLKKYWEFFEHDIEEYNKSL